MKETIKRVPVLSDFARALYRRAPRRLKQLAFPGSANYWEQRYAGGGNSGAGSYSFLAEFKAEVLNGFVAEHGVGSVIEFGHGDGNQLKLARYPKYAGFDVSPTAVAQCRKAFADDFSKSFRLADQYAGEQADLALSLDVIFHLVEDSVFEAYMRRLFAASRRYVIVYSSNTAENHGLEGDHVKHRRFTDWVAKNATEFKQIRHIPNRYPYTGDHRTGSFADFFVFEKS